MQVFKKYGMLPLAAIWLISAGCRHRKPQAAAAYAPVDTALAAKIGSNSTTSTTFVPVPAGLVARFSQPYATCVGRSAITFADANQTISGSLAYKIRHAEAISFTASVFLGVVAAQGLIRTDSFFVLNKLQNTMMYGGTAQLASLVGATLSIDMVEALLSGCYAYPQAVRALAATDSSMLGLVGTTTEDTASVLIKQGETAPRMLVFGGAARRAVGAEAVLFREHGERAWSDHRHLHDVAGPGAGLSAG